MIQGMAGFEYYRAFKQDTEQRLCSLSIKPIAEDIIFSFWYCSKEIEHLLQSIFTMYYTHLFKSIIKKSITTALVSLYKKEPSIHLELDSASTW